MLDSVVYWYKKSPIHFKELNLKIQLLLSLVFCFAVSQEVHFMKVMVAHVTCLNSHMEKSTYTKTKILGPLS